MVHSPLCEYSFISIGKSVVVGQGSLVLERQAEPQSHVKEAQVGALGWRRVRPESLFVERYVRGMLGWWVVVDVVMWQGLGSLGKSSKGRSREISRRRLNSMLC